MSTRPLKTPKPYKMGGTENEIRYTYKISDQIRVVGDPKIIALWFRRQFTKKKKRYVMSIDELYYNAFSVLHTTNGLLCKW